MKPVPHSCCLVVSGSILDQRQTKPLPQGKTVNTTYFNKETTEMDRERKMVLWLDEQTTKDETVDVEVKTSLFGLKTKELFHLRVPNPNQVEKHRVPKINEDNVVLASKIDHGETVPDIIGEGVYGMVLRAVLHRKGHRERVVVKSCHAEEYTNEHVLREAQFLQHLQGTGYVPRLFGVVHHQGLDGLCIVQALFAEGVTLSSVMGDFDKLPKTIRRHVAWNLAFGLKAIHGTGVVLNDLHAKNVLVDLNCPQRSIRYIDLGLASYGPQLFAPQGLEKHWQLAPELRAQGRGSPEADVYSLGIVIRRLNRGGVNCGQMAQAADVCLHVDPWRRDLDLVLFHLRDDGERTRADKPTRGWSLAKFFSKKTTQRSRDK